MGTENKKVELAICWTAKGRKKANRKELLERFGISSYMSVNHETICWINEEDLPLFTECERRGFFIIRKK